MNINRNTTPEQYQQWLATNPPIGEVARAFNKLMGLAKASCERIDRVVGKMVKKVSCLWRRAKEANIYNPSPVREPVEAASQGTKPPVVPLGYGGILYYRQMQMLDRIKDEIAMEQLHHEALKTLIN
ncbi:MAG: hypothetical protein EOO85_08705 [Pedobacter sp.]|nr:MAG: hypothetical protein EOO85_08705 [Pedobacter sp.]